MNKTLLSKTLAVSIILLLIGVSVSSAISVDNKPIISNNESIEDCGCNEVSDADLVKVERLLNKVEVYSKLLFVLSRDNKELVEKCQEVLDIINQFRELDYTIICAILALLIIQTYALMILFYSLVIVDNPILSYIFYLIATAFEILMLKLLGLYIVELKCGEWPDFP